MKRIVLFLVAILGIVAILALPAFAQHNGYDNGYGDDNYSGRGHDYDNDDYYGRGHDYDDDDDYYGRGHDRYEPRAPDCDWYGPYGYGKGAWWEYWCYWHGWGWEFVFWVWA